MLEADWSRCYQRDLRDDVETETARWMWVRIAGLPADAATWTPDLDEPEDVPQSAAGPAEISEWFGKHMKGG